MKSILFLLLTSLLFSCSTVYKETYVLERYPVEWDEEIIIPSDHCHYQDYHTCEWVCLYYPSDTVCWHQKDTIETLNLVKVEKFRKWALSN